MPLTGELEHLPIVDVIQLIHSTRKSGTLNVYSHNGEGQLAFNDGSIISATHSNEKLKIGQILLENRIIAQENLDKALGIQELSGEDRKPLIATLLDHCGLSKEEAFKALESLIEMTVVEMICWAKGVFTLDVDEVTISDDYRYLPEQLQSISLNTQMVLMDALRIFDEKVHSGEIKLSTEELLDNPLEQYEPPEDELKSETDINAPEIEISDDLLGLADLDQIERKKPHVFKGLEVFDPADLHRQIVNETIPELHESGKDELVSFLTDISSISQFDNRAPLASSSKSQAVIVFTNDLFLQHAIMTVCKNEGILVFVTADKNIIDHLIERALAKYLEPILVFGGPTANDDDFSKKQIISLRSQKMAQYPHISIIQLASPRDFNFSLQSLNDGSRAVFPLPYLSERKDTFAIDMIDFLNTFQVYIRDCFNEERRLQFAKLRNSLSGLRLLRKAPDISLMVLQFVSELFDRTLTLIVDKSDLIAERSIGMTTLKQNGVATPMNFKIPIHADSIFRKVIDSGESFIGKEAAPTLTNLVYPSIGTPADTTFLLLPLKSNNKVITITYADFGDHQSKQISLDFLEFFVSQAGLVMENALYRKRLGASN